VPTLGVGDDLRRPSALDDAGGAAERRRLQIAEVRNHHFRHGNLNCEADEVSSEEAACLPTSASRDPASECSLIGNDRDHDDPVFVRNRCVDAHTKGKIRSKGF